MNEITFTSLRELYKRLLPALKSKKKLLNNTGYSYITEEDIWNYMRFNKWNNTTGLELCDMVDDILHTNAKEIELYYIRNNKQEVDNINIDLPKLK